MGHDRKEQGFFFTLTQGLFVLEAPRNEGPDLLGEESVQRRLHLKKNKQEFAGRDGKKLGSGQREPAKGLHLLSLDPVSSEEFAPHGDIGNIWRTFWLS